MKLTGPLAQSLTNLRGHGDFKVFLDALKEYEQEHQQQCVDREGTPLYRAQGGAKALEAVLKAFADAPTTLEKLKQPK